MWNPENLVVDSRIFFNCARYGYSTELTLPEECYWEYAGFFGPNFLISDTLTTEPPTGVPTPSSALLLLAGLLMVGFTIQHARWPRTRRIGSAATTGYKIVALCTILGGQSALALSLTAQPVQGPASWDGQVPLGSRYQRYNHENVGAILEYDNVFDSAGNYIVPVGETLRWVWLRDGTQLGAFEFTYIGGPERCWVTSTGVQSCGNFNRFLSFNKFTCRPETGAYTLLVFREGVETLRHDFDTERFKMDTQASWWTHPTELRPKQRGTSTRGERKPVEFRVKDDLGCNLGIKDVEVTASSFVVPDTNLHGHFVPGTVGTGNFIEVSGFPATIDTRMTRIRGKTDFRGVFKAAYQAMDYALQEEVQLTFVRPARDGHPEQRLPPASIFWDIRWDHLMEPSIGNHSWLQNPTYCNHDPDRHARHLALLPSQSLLDGLDRYSGLAGNATLSLNDAGLPWGGAVDTLRGCGSHGSHRTGNDIDINNTDSEGRHFLANIENGWEAGEYLGRDLIDLLNRAMGQAGFTRVPEPIPSVHYRYTGLRLD